MVVQYRLADARFVSSTVVCKLQPILDILPQTRLGAAAATQRQEPAPGVVTSDGRAFEIHQPAPRNHPLRDLMYQVTGTIRPLIEVRWGV